jgi:hypothetical protein
VRMKAAMSSHFAMVLKPGEWHLPYVTKDEFFTLDPLIGRFDERLIKLSVARCARVSYMTTEGKKPTIEQDLALYERLLGSEPLHASPAEHQATPDTGDRLENGMIWWGQPYLHGNLSGWIQFRKTLPNEFVRG